MMGSISNIVFFFPYMEVSGVPVLFLNIAKKVIELYPNRYKVSIVDYQDGYMASQLNEEDNIDLLIFKTGEKFYIDSDYLVIQAILPEAMRPELEISERTKVFFWMLQPMNFLPIVFPFNFFHGYVESHLKSYSSILRRLYPVSYKSAKGVLNYLLDSNSVAFMNYSDTPTVEKFFQYIRLSPSYIPIASSDPITRKTIKKNNGDTIHLGWVGRLCDFKITILNYTMKCAFEYANKQHQKFLFHVVGDGDMAHLLFKKNSEFFKVDYVGSVAKNELDSYMVNHFDINFAMGTSAIESAKLGIPTVKLDFSYGAINGDYIFRWFHHSTGFDIGHVFLPEDFEEGNHSFDKIINDFINDGEKLGRAAFNHYQKYFSLDSVVCKLIDQIGVISSTWGDMPSIYKKKGIVRKVYNKLKYDLF